MDTKGLNFFGRYLIDKGIISQESLDDAIRFQEESNRRIGELAQERGYMGKEQIDAIFDEQKRVDQPFGAIALKLNFLTRGQLDDLLFAQTVFSTHLGEALLIKGYLSPEQFSEELELFRIAQAQREQQLSSTFDSLDNNEVHQAVVSALNRAFLRFCGRELKLDTFGELIDATFDFRFDLRISTRELGDVVCSVYLPEGLGGQMASGFEENNSASCRRECIEKLKGFFTVVERYLQIGLAEQGLEIAECSIVVSDQKPITPPSGKEGLIVQMTTPSQPLVMHTKLEKAPEASACKEGD